MNVYLVNFITCVKNDEGKELFFTNPVCGDRKRLEDVMNSLKENDDVLSVVALYVCTYKTDATAPIVIKERKKEEVKS